MLATDILIERVYFCVYNEYDMRLSKFSVFGKRKVHIHYINN